MKRRRLGLSWSKTLSLPSFARAAWAVTQFQKSTTTAATLASGPAVCAIGWLAVKSSSSRPL
jgi:hypothetical protein